MVTVAIRALELEYLVKILDWGRSRSRYHFFPTPTPPENFFRLRLHSPGSSTLTLTKQNPILKNKSFGYKTSLIYAVQRTPFSILTTILCVTNTKRYYTCLARSSWSHVVVYTAVWKMAGRLEVKCGQNAIRNYVLALLRFFINLYVYYAGNNCKYQIKNI
jgi:hypothetical protein